MSKTEREPGYYWILHFDGRWAIARWSGSNWKRWEALGTAILHIDADFLEIDERRIERQP